MDSISVGLTLLAEVFFMRFDVFDFCIIQPFPLNHPITLNAVFVLGSLQKQSLRPYRLSYLFGESPSS